MLAVTRAATHPERCAPVNMTGLPALACATASKAAAYSASLPSKNSAGGMSCQHTEDVGGEARAGPPQKAAHSADRLRSSN